MEKENHIILLDIFSKISEELSVIQTATPNSWELHTKYF